MNMEQLKQMLFSQQTALVCELLLMAVLVFLILLVSRQRKQRKSILRAAYEREQKHDLDAALENKRRR